MTDKDLLLKDLSARLPYLTLCYCKWTKDASNGTSGCIQEVSTYLLDELMIIGNQNYECQICEIKPYLRPMSSMTDEERNNLRVYCRTQEEIIYDIGVAGAINCPAIIDYLNAHHFDYRGLIEKGLALVAKEDMYKTKK